MKDFYRRNLPHIQPSTSRSVFVTMCTSDRWVLPPAARDLVMKHALHDHGTRLCMHGLVVMPDHLHLVFTPLADRDNQPYPLSALLGSLKGASAHSVNRMLGRRGAVWQDEAFDHIIRREELLRDKVEYLCQNPVRKGLVRTPDEYPWLWREWVDDA
jgi:REP element-mobilizing transposase RayT